VEQIRNPNIEIQNKSDEYPNLQRALLELADFLII